MHSSIMTKFINNLCLYLLHAVFSLVKPAISNTYLILMGFFFKFFYSYTLVSKVSSRLLIQALHQSFQGQCTSVQKGTRHRPCRFHFCKSNACQLAACFVPIAVAAYIVHVVLTYQLACIIWQAGRLGDKIESQEYKCKMPWTESTTTTTNTKVQFKKNSSPFEVFLCLFIMGQKMKKPSRQGREVSEGQRQAVHFLSHNKLAASMGH